MTQSGSKSRKMGAHCRRSPIKAGPSKVAFPCAEYYWIHESIPLCQAWAPVDDCQVSMVRMITHSRSELHCHLNGSKWRHHPMAQTSLRNQHFRLRAKIQIRCKLFSYSRQTRFDSKVEDGASGRVLGRCAAVMGASKDDLVETPSIA
jgi:hypothetical protein